jgi:ribosome-associated protein
VQRPDSSARHTDPASAEGAEASEEPSKSQRKRDAHALQELGAQLVGLPPGTLEELPLPAALREAVYAAQGMRQHGARKRQVQYIGKLLRQLDAATLRTALAALETRQAGTTRQRQTLQRVYRALLALVDIPDSTV